MGFRRFVAAFVLLAIAGCGSTSPDLRPPHPGPLNEALTVPQDALNADVTQGTIRETIYTPGYTATIRPSSHFTNSVKFRLMRDQVLPSSSAGDFVLDHRVPLALGGHPRSLDNLMLQPTEGAASAKRKDSLELRLNRLVCSGRLLLEHAQRVIYLDWQAADIAYPPSR